MWGDRAARQNTSRWFCGCLSMSAHCCVCVCFCCQLGGEEDSVWTDPVLEPHHTHHTVGEAYQVSTLCSPQKLKPRPLKSNSSRAMEDLIPDLSAPKLGKSVQNWCRLLKKKKKKVSDRLLQTVVFNDVEEPGK